MNKKLLIVITFVLIIIFTSLFLYKIKSDSYFCLRNGDCIQQCGGSCFNKYYDSIMKTCISAENHCGCINYVCQVVKTCRELGLPGDCNRPPF